MNSEIPRFEVAPNEYIKPTDTVRQERLDSFYKTLKHIDISQIRLEGDNSQATEVRGVGSFGIEASEHSQNTPVGLNIKFPNRNYYKQEVYIGYKNEELEQGFSDYNNLLQEIENVYKRQIGQDRTPKLRENLEHRREVLHNHMAKLVIDDLKDRNVAIDLQNARLFVEALDKCWRLETLIQGQDFNVAFGALNINKLQEQVQDSYGLKLEYMKMREGYHDEEPIYYYQISLSGPEVNIKKEQALRFIEDEVLKQSVIESAVKISKEGLMSSPEISSLELFGNSEFSKSYDLLFAALKDKNVEAVQKIVEDLDEVLRQISWDRLGRFSYQQRDKLTDLANIFYELKKSLSNISLEQIPWEDIYRSLNIVFK